MPVKKMKKRRRSALPSIKTRYGFAAHIRYVFEEGAKYHGREVAQDYLRIFGAPPTKKQMRQLRDARVLDRLLAMKPAPQPYKLARQLANENKRLPKADRWGTGTTNERAMAKYIERLWKAHKARKPGPPPTGGTVFIITSPPRR